MWLREKLASENTDRAAKLASENTDTAARRTQPDYRIEWDGDPLLFYYPPPAAAKGPPRSLRSLLLSATRFVLHPGSNYLWATLESFFAVHLSR